MAASIRNLCRRQADTFLTILQQRCPSVYQTRGKKVNIQKPRPGHIVRQVMAKVTSPIIAEVYEDPAHSCTRRVGLVDGLNRISEYEEFLIRHYKSQMNDNEDGIIALLFSASCDSKTYRKHKVALLKKQMYVSRVNRKVFMHSVKGTKYETMNLVTGLSTLMVVCKEPNMKQFMDLVKKMPAFHPLCAVVEGQLLSKTEMETYASFPIKSEMLAQTCALLNHSQQGLTSLLSTQQEQLVHNLKTYSESNDTES